MKSFGYLAALASLLAGGAAHAQETPNAFQCALPYEHSMKALGSLEVLSQSTVSAFPGLHGEGNLIEFAPSGTTVFGAQPSKLTLEVLTPHKLQPKEKYVITLASTFAKTAAADEAIQRSVTWHIQCGTLDFCIRSSEAAPSGAGRLEYRRKASLELKCIFEFTPEEFDALGS